MTRASKTLAKPAANAIDDDDRESGHPTQRVVSAAGAPRVATSAPASIFAVGQVAKPARKYTPRTYIDPAAIAIKTGVPIPTQGGPKAVSPYSTLFGRMPVGGMVELSPRRAAGLMSWGKKHAPGQLVRRALSANVAGVWRVEAKG